MDVVYPLKRGGEHNELRWSLRSLENLPHDDVYLVGGKPDWVTGIQHLESTKGPTKYKDSTANLVAACNNPDVSDPFILMNDDFFVMNPIDQVPVLNRGRVQDVIRDFTRRGIGSMYVQGMRQTLKELEFHGYENPLSFELHVPLVVHKQPMLRAIQLGHIVDVWHKRTAYGALMMLEGETVPDVKIHDKCAVPDRKTTFLSTSDGSFADGRAGLYIRDEFPEASSYEL